LASVAVTVREQVYLFGGYIVTEDYHEVSTPEVLRFNPILETYERVADIPVPSDDATAFVYQDRYIFLVSGWHDKGNINLVQVYDVENDTWQQAKLLVCDGVKINYPLVAEAETTKREFKMSNECYLGRIDDKDITRIHWSVVPKHLGAARYRMAAVGDETRQEVIFVGGSDNPYNFNGIGYDGVASKAVASVFAYAIETNEWLDYGSIENSTMDHRGLLKMDDGFVVVGGMDSNQEVLTNTYKILLNNK